MDSHNKLPICFFLCLIAVFSCSMAFAEDEGESMTDLKEVTIPFLMNAIVPIENISPCTQYSFYVDSDTAFRLNINEKSNIKSLLITDKVISECEEVEETNCVEPPEEEELGFAFCSKVQFTEEKNLDLVTTPNSMLSQLHIYPTLHHEESEGSLQIVFTPAGNQLPFVS